VNAYLWAATVLLLGLVPLLVVCVRARPLDALPAVALAGSVTALVLLLLAEGFERSVYFVVPLALTLMSFVGAFVYVRLLARLR
jgi:multisubunit Na+/H+ antiporter MnhF subunit